MRSEFVASIARNIINRNGTSGRVSGAILVAVGFNPRYMGTSTPRRVAAPYWMQEATATRWMREETSFYRGLKPTATERPALTGRRARSRHTVFYDMNVLLMRQFRNEGF